MKEVEIRFETLPPTEGVKRFQLAIIPSIFVKSWQFSIVRYVNVNTVILTNHGHNSDPSHPVNLEQFDTFLREALEEANMLAGRFPNNTNGKAKVMSERKAGTRPLSDQHVGNTSTLLNKTYQRLRRVVADKIIGELINTWQEGNVSITSTYHAYDIRRNLVEIRALQQMESLLAGSTKSQRDPRLKPEDIGAMLTPYITISEGKLNGFKLSESPGGHPMSCAFDSAIRLAAYNVKRVTGDGSNGYVLIIPLEWRAAAHYAKDLDMMTAEFLKQCKNDGAIASAAGGIALLYSTFVALKITHNITDKNGLRVQDSECANLMRSWEADIKKNIRECIKHLTMTDKTKICAFSYESDAKACTSASYYAIRALGHLGQFSDNSQHNSYNFIEESWLIKDFLQEIKQLVRRRNFWIF